MADTASISLDLVTSLFSERIEFVISPVQIALRSQQIWQSRGCPIGDGKADWYEAEQQLMREAIIEWVQKNLIVNPGELFETGSSAHVFVGSSKEGLPVAKAIQVLLDHCCEVTVWNQGVFAISTGRIEALIRHSKLFDFAVLAVTPDDWIKTRGMESWSPRDNVTFELGMFVTALGLERTFLVYDRSVQLKLPSDYDGITHATYKPHASGNVEASLGAACAQIEKAILKVGSRKGNVRFSFPR